MAHGNGSTDGAIDRGACVIFKQCAFLGSRAPSLVTTSWLFIVFSRCISMHRQLPNPATRLSWGACVSALCPVRLGVSSFQFACFAVQLCLILEINAMQVSYRGFILVLTGCVEWCIVFDPARTFL